MQCQRGWWKSVILPACYYSKNSTLWLLSTLQKIHGLADLKNISLFLSWLHSMHLCRTLTAAWRTVPEATKGRAGAGSGTQSISSKPAYTVIYPLPTYFKTSFKLWTSFTTTALQCEVCVSFALTQRNHIMSRCHCTQQHTRCCTSNAMFNILLFDFAYAGEVLALDWRRWNLKHTWNIFRSQWDWHSLHACTGSAGLCSLKPSCTMQTCAVGTEQMCSMLEVRWGMSTGSKKGNSCWSNPCFPRDSIASLITRSAPAALQEPHIDSLTPRGIWKSTACLQEAASPEGTSEWDSFTVPSALVLQCR